MKHLPIFSSAPYGTLVAVLGLSLTLGACTGLTRTSRLMIPPPPAAIGDLEEPKRSAPVLASQLQAPTKSHVERELQNFFEAWQAAWLARNFDRYLTHYAPAFSGNGTPALRWQTRRLRMVQGKSEQADLSFGPLTINIEDEHYAQLSFAQQFEDGELSETGTKQWQLRQINGRWQIEQEIFERRLP